MKVTLIEFTGKGNPNPARHAANILMFSKSTRLQMSASLMEDINNWSEDKVENELEYMANTIPSSWEFLDFIFLLEGVSRAFTHQLVRTRPNSYAQQTMRVLDVSEGPGWDYVTGPTIAKDQGRKAIYEATMDCIADGYKSLIDAGAAIEDARGVLPTNIQTNILVKTNFRTLVETMHKRASPRTQGEYRQVIDLQRFLVLQVYPWAHHFLNRTVDQAIIDLQAMIDGTGETPEWRTQATKLLDQLRTKL